MRVLRVSFLSALMLEMLSIAIVALEIGVRLLNGGIAFEQALFLLIIAPTCGRITWAKAWQMMAELRLIIPAGHRILAIRRWRVIASNRVL